MTIFSVSDHREFVKSRVRSLGPSRRGEMSRIASAIGVHTTTLSQILSGKKEFSYEQTAKLCEYWGLTELESEYFLTLVEIERAGNAQLKAILHRRRKALKERSELITQRVQHDRKLTDQERNLFYSQWYFSAIRLLCDIPQYRNPDLISQRLQLPRSLVNQVLEFLISAGLVIDDEKGLRLGSQRTMLESTSNLISRHHSNWRIEVISKYPQMNHLTDLALTAPMTISQGDAQKVRSLLLDTIEQIMKLNSASPSEELRILNIDWLNI